MNVDQGWKRNIVYVIDTAPLLAETGPTATEGCGAAAARDVMR